MIPLLIVLCLGRSESVVVGRWYLVDGNLWRPDTPSVERHTMLGVRDKWCVPITEPYDYYGEDPNPPLPGYWDADGRYLPIPDEGLIFIFDEKVCYVSRSGVEYCSRFDVDEPGVA